MSRQVATPAGPDHLTSRGYEPKASGGGSEDEESETSEVHSGNTTVRQKMRFGEPVSESMPQRLAAQMVLFYEAYMCASDRAAKPDQKEDGNIDGIRARFNSQSHQAVLI